MPIVMFTHSFIFEPPPPPRPHPVRRLPHELEVGARGVDNRRCARAQEDELAVGGRLLRARDRRLEERAPPFAADRRGRRCHALGRERAQSTTVLPALSALEHRGQHRGRGLERRRHEYVSAHAAPRRRALRDLDDARLVLRLERAALLDGAVPHQSLRPPFARLSAMPRPMMPRPTNPTRSDIFEMCVTPRGVGAPVSGAGQRDGEHDVLDAAGGGVGLGGEAARRGAVRRERREARLEGGRRPGGREETIASWAQARASRIRTQDAAGHVLALCCARRSSALRDEGRPAHRRAAGAAAADRVGLRLRDAARVVGAFARRRHRRPRRFDFIRCATRSVAVRCAPTDCASVPSAWFSGLACSAPLVPVRRRPRLDVSSPRRRSAPRAAQGGRGARRVRGQGVGRGAGLGGSVRRVLVVQRRGEQGG